MLVSKYEHQLRTEKITTRKKKGTVFWPAMFFEPPEKIMTKKKKVQSSDRRLKWISDNRLLCQNTNTPITTGKNYYRKIKYDTVVWSSVMSKYEHHQSHFHLRKFLLGFFILQKQWDPNFLLVCISFLLCTTVPIFSGSNFFRSYVSTIIGACVKIRTLIMKRKN